MEKNVRLGRAPESQSMQGEGVFDRVVGKSASRKNCLHALKASVALALLLAAQPLAAQNVLPDTNLMTLGAPTDGTVWTLQGDASVSGAVTTTALPVTGASGLTINGASGGSTVRMNDNAGHYGFFSGTSTNMTVSDVTFTGSATNGVIASSANLTLNTSGNVVFDSNKSSWSGIGTYGAGLSSVGSTTVNGSVTFSNNTSSQGGGILAGQAVTVTGNFTGLNNTVASWGGVIQAGGMVTLASDAGSNVTLIGNKGGGGGGGAIATNGGVNLGNATSTVIVTGNSTAGTGGAIYNSSTTTGVTISGSSITFSNNTNTGTTTATTSADGRGAGISSRSLVTINGDLTAEGNRANGAGGAIYVSAGGVTVNGSLNANNNVAVLNTSLYPGGGAVIAADAGNITVTGGIALNGNTATARAGGAIDAENGAIRLAGTSGNVVITNNSAGRGGAVYGNGIVNIGNTSATVLIGVDTGGGAAGNTGTFGGAIYSGGTMAITGNTITISNNQSTVGNGGAIYSGGATTLTAGTILVSNNQSAAANGGGIYSYSSFQANGALTANGNTAGQAGGAIYTQYGSLSVASDVSMSNNKALTGNGGAIYAQSAAVATVSGAVTLTNNSAGGAGGAMYIVSNSANALVMGNAAATMTLTGNAAGTAGGAIYSNASMTFTGSTIILSGNLASNGNGGGIYAANTVTINGALAANSNVATAGSGGAIAVNAGGVAINGTLSASGNSANTNGGAIHANAGTISITGAVSLDGNIAQNGFGGAVGTVSGNIVVTGSMTARGNTAATSGGALHATAGNILTTGAATFDGNRAQGGAGGAINAANGDATLASATGDVALTNNTATLNGGAISATGKVALGNVSGAVNATGNTATLNGGALYGGGSTTLTGATTLRSNNAASGSGGAIYANGAFTLNATGTTSFEGNTAFAKGGAVYANGDVTLNAVGGDISFSGNTHGDPIANAIYLNNAGGAATATFNANAGNVITFFDPIENNLANGAMSVIKDGDGIVSFDGSRHGAQIDRWSKIYGDTIVQAGAFEIANNAIYGTLAADVAAATPTNFTVASGATVLGGRLATLRADNLTLDGDLSVAGRQPDTRGVFNVDSRNMVFGGGNVLFNSYLNDGVVQNTDLLVLNLNGSATSGQAIVLVTAAGGSGAITTGDGIKIVQANNGTTAGAFTLGNRVASGAYEYGLFYGGFAPTGGNPDDQNWYLRNTLVPDPTPENPNPPPVPNIRVEVPLDMAIPPLAFEYGYAMLDTLHERVGEPFARLMDPAIEERAVWCKNPASNFRCVTRVPVATATGADTTRWASSGWALLLGERGIHKNDNFFTHGADYNYTISGLQAGLDIFAREQSDGTLDKAGIYVGIGQISSDVKGAFGGKAGSIDMDAYTVGGYWTHYAPEGWYTDAVIQGTWYSANAHSVYNQQIKPEGFGIVASLEAGYVFKLGNNWTLEPQAQLAYQNVSFDNAHDQFGFVNFDGGESLRGRLGVRVTKSWNMADEVKPRLIKAWMRANVWHEFKGNTKTSFGSLDGQNMVPFYSNFGGTWAEVGVGVSGQISDTTSLFAMAAYNRSLDNKGRQGWDGRLGMTVKW